VSVFLNNRYKNAYFLCRLLNTVNTKNNGPTNFGVTRVEKFGSPSVKPKILLPPLPWLPAPTMIPWVLHILVPIFTKYHRFFSLPTSTSCLSFLGWFQQGSILTGQQPLSTGARSLPPSHGVIGARAALTSTDRPERTVPLLLEPWRLVPPGRYRPPLEPVAYS
jgi:hypothetical protein